MLVAQLAENVHTVSVSRGAVPCLRGSATHAAMVVTPAAARLYQRILHARAAFAAASPVIGAYGPKRNRPMITSTAASGNEATGPYRFSSGIRTSSIALRRCWVDLRWAVIPSNMVTSGPGPHPG